MKHFYCPNCRIRFDLAPQKPGEPPKVPRAGDLTVCYNCRTPIVFQGAPGGVAMAVRKLSVQAMARLPPEAKRGLIQSAMNAAAVSHSLKGPKS